MSCSGKIDDLAVDVSRATVAAGWLTSQIRNSSPWPISISAFRASALRRRGIFFSITSPIRCHALDNVAFEENADHDERRNRRRRQRRHRPPLIPASRSGSPPSPHRRGVWEVEEGGEKNRSSTEPAPNEGRHHAGRGERKDDAEEAPQIDRPSTSAASSSSTGMPANWSRMIQMTIAAPQRVKHHQADRGVEQSQFLVESQEGQSEHHRGRMSCDRKKKEMSLLRIQPIL